MQSPLNELVVLTHGIASTRFLMSPLAARLRRAGFATRLHGYPSIWGSNRGHGVRFARLLRRLAPRYDRVHMVVHSMGSIVARCALTEGLPPNFGRIVMIAPPNRGSHMATRLTAHSSSAVWNALVVWPHRTLAPTLRELTDGPESFVNLLGPIPEGVDVGVLAASNDNVLHPHQTHVEGQRDHRTVSSWHTGILWKRETAELAARFLQTGAFGESSQQSALSGQQPRAIAEGAKFC
ncbi:MAG: esterase/lipase family protein [Lacipirellulaceae bacterium]